MIFLKSEVDTMIYSVNQTERLFSKRLKWIICLTNGSYPNFYSNKASRSQLYNAPWSVLTSSLILIVLFCSQLLLYLFSLVVLFVTSDTWHFMSLYIHKNLHFYKQPLQSSNFLFVEFRSTINPNIFLYDDGFLLLK